MNKIIITGDLLRPSSDGKVSNQRINIDWFYNLLKYPIQQATNLPVEVKHWNYKGGTFNSKEFYNLNGYDCSLDSWLNIYYSKYYTEEAKNYIEKEFKNSIVIGFELPHILQVIFSDLNIIYIDVIIHPIRFLNDLIFGFKTNNKQIFNELFKYNVDEYYFYTYSSIHKATITKMPSLKLEKNSALFTGQVEVDKSLIQNNKCLTIDDFKNDLQQISKKYNKLYVKKHPYAKKDISKSFLSEINNVEFIDENFYYLLAQDEIESVYSISSSTVLESKYWDKKSSYLYKNHFSFVTKNIFNEQQYMTIKDVYMSSSFWSNIFSKILAVNKSTYDVKLNDNILRNSLDSYWGYEFLSNDLILRNSNIKQNDNIAFILEALEPISQILTTKLNKDGITKMIINKKVKNPSLFQQYQNSRWMSKAQRIKYVPYVGSSLLYVKRKILKWDI